MDPKNPRVGISPIYSAMREIWSDMDAARMVAQMLKNNGVPGLVLSPKSPDVTIDDPEATKDYIEKRFTGAGRGKPIVMMGATDVHQYGFNPQEMDLSSVRNVSEERVTALLGIPAAVIGFGTGLQNTKVGATMEEMRKLAWSNGVVPILRALEGEINRSLTPELAGDGWRFRFSLDNVEALQEDRNQKAERVSLLVSRGMITRGEGLEQLGLEATPDDDVYLLPISTLVVPRGEDPNALRQPAPVDPPEEGDDPDDDEGDDEKGLKHQHTLTEERLAESAPRARQIPQVLSRMASQFERVLPGLEEAFAGDLEAHFAAMGRAAERAALEVLDAKDALLSLIHI